MTLFGRNYEKVVKKCRVFSHKKKLNKLKEKYSVFITFIGSSFFDIEFDQ